MTQPSRTFPKSPCVRLCTLDDDGCCVGCFRLIEEIMRWSAMTPEQQWEVVEAAEHRRQSAQSLGR